MGPEISLSRGRDLVLVDVLWWSGVVRELLVAPEDGKVAMDMLWGKDSSD